MTKTAQREEASFRDPAGHVYYFDDRVFRSVTSFGAENYVFARDSGLLPKLIADNKLIATKEVSAAEVDSIVPQPCYLLEHPSLPFVSYPYEWCFSALRDAAVLQLDLLLDALDHDVTLSDASAFNVQFHGAAPVFIDALSFVRYRDGDYWLGHQQFCDQFLHPLLLTAKSGVAFNPWFRSSLQGISGKDLNALIPWWRRLNWRWIVHITLPVRFQAKAIDKGGVRLRQHKQRPLPRPAFRQMVQSLRSWVAHLKPAARSTHGWTDYSANNSYDSDAFAAKSAFVERFAASVKPEMLWDVGCNTGRYSEIALQAGAHYAVGFDADPDSIEAAFARAKAKNLAFLPLILDAANPSPGQGWLSRERKGLDTRATADGLLALAVLHHLAIGHAIPLAEAVAWLVSLAPQGVLEFVEKEDPMVQFMLQLREDIFPTYSRDAFLTALGSQAEIIEQKPILDNRRLLVWYRRQDP